MYTQSEMQQTFDRRLPDERGEPILTGTVELHPDADNTLEIPVKVEFLSGQAIKLWICSITSGNWHPLPMEMGDCIGESSTYIPEAYDVLIGYAREDYEQSLVEAHQ